MGEKFVSKAVGDNGEMGSEEGGVLLGWLPMTRRHLDWITWSLR